MCPDVCVWLLALQWNAILCGAICLKQWTVNPSHLKLPFLVCCVKNKCQGSEFRLRTSSDSSAQVRAARASRRPLQPATQLLCILWPAITYQRSTALRMGLKQQSQHSAMTSHLRCSSPTSMLRPLNDKECLGLAAAQGQSCHWVSSSSYA